MKINLKSKNLWTIIILFLLSILLSIFLSITSIEKSRANTENKKNNIVNKNYAKNMSYLEKFANKFQNKTYFVSPQNKKLNNVTKKEIFEIMKLKEPNVYIPTNKFIKIISNENTNIGNSGIKLKLEISKNNISKIITINLKRIPSLEEMNNLEEQEINKKIYTISSKFNTLSGEATVELKKIIKKDIEKLYPNKKISVLIKNNLKIPWENPIINKLFLSPKVKVGTVYNHSDVIEPAILIKRMPTLMEANNISEQKDINLSKKKISYSLLNDKKSEFVSSLNLRLGNKYFTDKENKLRDWGLTFKQVFPNKPILNEKAFDVTLEYINYEFNNKKINARLIWRENKKYKAKNILVRGFLDPKIKTDDHQEIYDEEFKNLVLPNSFRIPESINKINSTAFQWTVLPENWVHPKVWKEEIPESAYYGARIPKNFVIPTSVKKISDRAFQNAKGYLPKIIPSSITKIGLKAFKNSEGKLPLIPNSVKEIGSSAFSGHILPNNWLNPMAWKTIIPKYGYFDVTFQNSFKIPDTVTKLGYASFGCVKLSNNFQLSKNLIEIGEYAFYRAEGKILEIPTSIKKISKNAFIEFRGTVPSISNSVTRTS